MRPHPRRTLPRLSRLLGALGAVAWLAWAAPPATADPVWPNVPIVPFKVMQAVNADGSAAWSVPPDVTVPPLPGGAYRLVGIVLNNPADMLDATPNFAAGYSGGIGGQWQVFIQAVEADDYGGAALWMGQNYGIRYGRGPHPTDSYTDADWLAEMARVDYPLLPGGGQSSEPLRAGDVIEVRARGGLFYGGKFNANEMHWSDPLFNFDIIRLGHADLPVPTPVTLDLVKNPDNTFRFNQDRSLLDNPEHYQATLVELQGVRLQDPVDFLTNNATYTLVDAAGLTFPMKLGLGGFDGLPAPQGFFDVVGIFNQEGSNMAGYQIWVMDSGQFAAHAVPEPASIVLIALGAALLAFARRQRRRAVL